MKISFSYKRDNFEMISNIVRQRRLFQYCLRPNQTDEIISALSWTRLDRRDYFSIVSDTAGQTRLFQYCLGHRYTRLFSVLPWTTVRRDYFSIASDVQSILHLNTRIHNNVGHTNTVRSSVVTNYIMLFVQEIKVHNSNQHWRKTVQSKITERIVVLLRLSSVDRMAT